MSVSIEQVFEAIFPEIYTYDQQYNEIKSNQKLDIMKYPYSIRRLVYDNYHKLKDINKEKLTTSELESIMDKDPDVKFIRNLYSQDEAFCDAGVPKVYKHLTKEDYNYVSMNENDRNHTTMDYIVMYDKSVFNTTEDIYNVNHYLKNNMFPVKNNYDQVLLLKVIDFDNLSNARFIEKYINRDTSFGILINRFVIDESHTIIDLRRQMNIVDNNLTTSLMDDYIDCLRENNKCITRLDEEVVNAVFKEVIDYYNTITQKYSLTSEQFIDDVIVNNKDNHEKLIGYINRCGEKQRDSIIGEMFLLFARLGFKIDNIVDYMNDYTNSKNILEHYVTIISQTNQRANKEVVEKLMDCYLENYSKAAPTIRTKLETLLIKLITLSDFGIYELNNAKTEMFLYMDKPTKLCNSVIKHACDNGTYDSLLQHPLFAGKESLLFVRILAEFMERDIHNKEHEYKQVVLDLVESADDPCGALRTTFYGLEHTLGWKYIEAYKEVPPLKIYTNPKIENISNIWRKVTSFEIPLEMTNQKYYDYMISHDGEKRPENITAMYSYFSNTAENKLIFISNDDVLDKPAKLRYIIPVKYDVIKEFVTEDIDTNDICLFTTVSNADWAKIANSNERLDIVAFSDIKNVYKERTPMKTLIQFFKDAIELKFDCSLKLEEI